MESISLRSAIRGRRIECLTEKQTISSFNSWKQNLEFQLTACADFVPFLGRGFTWRPQRVLHRGLTDDGEDIPAAQRKLALQKHAVLDHMIRLISSYCPVHIQSEIERKCTSLDWIWQRIRRHYGFAQSEVHFYPSAEKPKGCCYEHVRLSLRPSVPPSLRRHFTIFAVQGAFIHQLSSFLVCRLVITLFCESLNDFEKK